MGDFPFRDPDEARFEKPTLFIRGTESSYVADDVLPLIGRFFPRFELRDIVSGHWVISEKPEEFRTGKLTPPKWLRVTDKDDCQLWLSSCRRTSLRGHGRVLHVHGAHQACGRMWNSATSCDTQASAMDMEIT